jgi:hypothetical protein
MTKGNSSVYPSEGSTAISKAAEGMRSRSAEFAAGTVHEGSSPLDDKGYTDYTPDASPPPNIRAVQRATERGLGTPDKARYNMYRDKGYDHGQALKLTRTAQAKRRQDKGR